MDFFQPCLLKRRRGFLFTWETVLTDERSSIHEHKKRDILMMLGSDRLKMAQESRGSQPVESVHRLPNSAPPWFEPNLQIKGFGGGVPPNTETAAVKPRVGIE
jgi:hypothetical protein